MLKHRKTRIWIAIAIVAVVIAAPIVYVALQPDHFPCEPPIDEQVKAQYKALMNGADIPLPIPLVVGDTELREFSLDALRETLLANGFKEVTKDNLSEFSADVQQRLGKKPLFVNKDEKIAVEWITQKFRPDLASSSIRISFTNADLLPEEVERTFSDGSCQMITLRDGMYLSADLESIKAKVKYINHSYGYHDYYFKKHGRKSESISLNRGVYLYLLYFKDGKLTSIVVIDMREGIEISNANLNAEEVRKKIKDLFDARESMEIKLSRYLKQIRDILGI